MVWLSVFFVFGLCFCLFNYWFQRDRFKRMPEEEIKRHNRFNRPQAWLLYTIVFFVAALFMISYYIHQMFIAIMRLN